jgi:hypothetical protein
MGYGAFSGYFPPEDEEPYFDDGPTYRRTNCGAVDLVEDGNLVYLDPDPFEIQLDAYLERQAAEYDAWMSLVDERVAMLSTPCHDDEAPHFHHGRREVPTDAYFTPSARFSTINVRVRRPMRTEHVDWVDLYSMGAGIDDAAIAARM